MTVKTHDRDQSLKNQVDGEVKTGDDVDEAIVNDTVADPKTRLSRVQAIIGALGKVDDESLKKLYDDVWPTIETASKGGTGGYAKNSASVKTTKEELAEIFKGQELSEEFVSKATTLFETAVNLKVMEELTVLEVAVEERTKKETEEFTETLVRTLSDYVDEALSEWMEENSEIVEGAIKVTMAEEFLGGLRSLFESHNVVISDEEVKVSEELIERNKQLEADLAKKIRELSELNDQLAEAERQVSVDEALEGLTPAQADKLRPLVEAIDAESAEEFQEKAKVVRESFLTKRPSREGVVDSLVVEETDQPVIESFDPRVTKAAEVMSRLFPKAS